MSLDLTVEHTLPSGERICAAEFTVADSTACIKLHVRESQISSLPLGAVVLLQGCRIADFDGHMFLKLGPWTDIIVATPAPAPPQPGSLSRVGGDPAPVPAGCVPPVPVEQLPALRNMSAVKLVAPA